MDPISENTMVVLLTEGCIMTRSLSWRSSFTDVPVWAEKAINWLSARNVVTGTSATKFTPSKNVTRAEFIAMLMRTIQVPISTAGVKQFSDVAAGKWYYNDILKAKALGIAAGNSSGKFNPTAPIKREDIAVLIGRIAETCSYSLKYDSGETQCQRFDDNADISGYAAYYMEMMVQNGILNGSSNKLRPRANATRAEAAAMIHRLLLTDIETITKGL